MSLDHDPITGRYTPGADNSGHLDPSGTWETYGSWDSPERFFVFSYMGELDFDYVIPVPKGFYLMYNELEYMLERHALRVANEEHQRRMQEILEDEPF